MASASVQELPHHGMRRLADHVIHAIESFLSSVNNEQSEISHVDELQPIIPRTRSESLPTAP
jgi:hypothetical protein